MENQPANTAPQNTVSPVQPSSPAPPTTTTQPPTNPPQPQPAIPSQPKPKFPFKLITLVLIFLLIAIVVSISIIRPPGFLLTYPPFRSLIKTINPNALPVAIVNGIKITNKEYENRLNSEKNYYVGNENRQTGVNFEDKVLEDLIKEVLLTQVLNENNMEVTSEEIRQRIKETIIDKSFGGDWQKYEEELKNKYYTDITQVEKIFRLEITKEKVSSLQTKKHIFAIWVEKIEPQFASSASLNEETLKALQKANSPKEEKANKALSKLQNDENPAEVAKEFSEDPESLKTSGDLGFLFLPNSATSLKQDKLEVFPGKTAVFEAIKELNKNESKLYELLHGYAVIKVTDIEKGILQNKSFEEWYPDYRTQSEVIIL